MERGEIDQPFLQILHLDTELGDLTQQAVDRGKRALGSFRRATDSARIEAASVPGYPPPDVAQPPPVPDELPSSLDQPLGQRPDDLEGEIRLFRREIPHGWIVSLRWTSELYEL